MPAVFLFFGRGWLFSVMREVVAVFKAVGGAHNKGKIIIKLLCIGRIKRLVQNLDEFNTARADFQLLCGSPEIFIGFVLFNRYLYSAN